MALSRAGGVRCCHAVLLRCMWHALGWCCGAEENKPISVGWWICCRTKSAAAGLLLQRGFCCWALQLCLPASLLLLLAVLTSQRADSGLTAVVAREQQRQRAALRCILVANHVLVLVLYFCVGLPPSGRKSTRVSCFGSTINSLRNPCDVRSLQLESCWRCDHQASSTQSDSRTPSKANAITY
eukprot:COSAG01_NODE_22737_length_843_cov_1.581989_1_plen_183_part_00